MITFASVLIRYDEYSRQFTQYALRRQISFILSGLASLLGYVGLHLHTNIAMLFCILLFGSSVFLYVTAEKRLYSILDALSKDSLDQPPIRMSVQENISYLQMKNALSHKLIQATTNLL